MDVKMNELVGAITALNPQKKAMAEYLNQGVKFHEGTKIWYIDDGSSKANFADMIYDFDNYNIIAPHYFVVDITVNCYTCGEKTLISTLLLPSLLKYENDEKQWKPSLGYSFLFHINDVPDLIAKTIKSGTYYKDKSQTTGIRYWMNHCAICGERMGDYEIHCVFDDALKIITIEKILHARVRKIEKLFIAQAGNSNNSADLVRFLRKAEFPVNDALS